MPSETMDFKSLSSSLFSFEDICSPTKKQDGFWKSDNRISDCYENNIVDVIATQHESSLFSSSLSELFSRKLRLSANNALYGHSVDNAASQYDEEDMLFESLEELEAQTIRNLLPDDDDDLLAGLNDGLDDHIVRDSATVDLDELDIFASVGGMDLGDDDDNPSSGQKNSELVVGTCNSQQELCNASIAGEHFSRTLLVKNIHPELEQKEFSCRLHQKSPPLNSSTSRPATCAPSLEASFLHGVSSSLPNALPSGLKSVGNQCRITEFGSPRELNFGIQGSSAFDTHSLPECHDGLANVFLPNSPELAAYINCKTQERIHNMQYCQPNYNGHPMEFNEYAFKSYGNGSCALPGHYKWRNSYHTRGVKWPNSASYLNGIYAGPTLPRLRGVPRSPSHVMRPVLSMNNYHMSSAPSVNCNIWDMQPAYATHCADLTSHYNFPHFGRNYADLQFQNQRGMMFPQRNHMIPMINSFGTHKEHVRGRRNVAGSNLVDKKQYELDINRIIKGEDNRTTLMIKNIPNKYTSKMLLAAIDQHHKGTYDFVYLPIDFKNKCNVGYAFINMTDPSLIIPFYQVFNGKKWEKFNSEKVATLAYARIQGKEALIAHFQNSSLMNEDKRCRPILFSTDGPNAGDQVPFPVGVNIRNKPGRSRNNSLEDKLMASPPYPGTGKLSPGGDCDSKDSN